MGTGGTNQDLALSRLREALVRQRAYVAAYEQPSEPLAYETLRTLDDLFCRDLMEPTRPVDTKERLFRRVSSWGVNNALRRIVPTAPQPELLRDFPSHDTIQAQADDFVFNCATLALSERFEGWLRDGILTGELRRYPSPERHGIRDVLVLRSAVPSYSDEEIGSAGLRWSSDRTWAIDRSQELELEELHRQLVPDLVRRVDLVGGWRMTYVSTPAIDDYFLDWGRLYLRRIFSQDLIGPDDVIGGRPFSRYVDVLSALSGRSQKHIAFAAIVRARHPSVHIRNLLTTLSDRGSFIDSLARYLDADRGEIEAILSSFILTGDNLERHTQGGETAWAPIVQASANTLILPVYGLDINPFLFLLTDLRSRYETDWFRVANNRERRWITELEGLFEDPWHTHGQNLRLREAGQDVTDIDFAAFEPQANELALFQLKWQHPVGMDNRGRRSAGRNLIDESNRWIHSVMSWLARHGVSELMRRLGFPPSSGPAVHLFVLGRYQVHFTGFDSRHAGAVWSDWAHFHRVRLEKPGCSASQMASILQSTIEQTRASKTGESMMFPVGDIALSLNPTSVPHVPER